MKLIIEILKSSTSERIALAQNNMTTFAESLLVFNTDNTDYIATLLMDIKRVDTPIFNSIFMEMSRSAVTSAKRSFLMALCFRHIVLFKDLASKWLSREIIESYGQFLANTLEHEGRYWAKKNLVEKGVIDIAVECTNPRYKKRMKRSLINFFEVDYFPHEEIRVIKEKIENA